MLTREQKAEQVVEIKGRLERATSVFVADPCGLDVGQVNDLRSQVREKGEGAYDYQVVKNSVLRLAFQGTDGEALCDLFRGPTAVAFSYGDPAGLAKVLADYAKAHDAFALKGGYVEGKPVGTDEIVTLATLPSLDELRATLIGLLQAPATKLAKLLKEPGGQLARLLVARKDSLES